MSDYGRLQEVVTIARSTDLTIDATISDTEIVVDSAGDFDEDGGTLQLNGAQLDYTAIEWGVGEEDPDTITLAEPLAAAAEVDDNVQPVDGGLPVEDWYAIVDMGPGDSVYVPLTFAQRAQWPEGTYDPPVRVIVSDDLQNLEDAPGRPPTAGQRMVGWNTDAATAAADDAAVTINLTHVPNDGTLHVRKNGVDLEPSEWVYDATTNTIAVAPSAICVIRIGCRFTTAYFYDGAGALVGAGSNDATLDDVVAGFSPDAYFKLTETSGTALLDSSGNGHDDATGYHTGFTFGAGGLDDSMPADPAVTFDGATANVAAAVSPWMDTAVGLSLMALIEPSGDGDGTGMVVVARDNNGSVGPWNLRLDGSDRPAFSVWSGGSPHTATGSPVSVSGTRYAIGARYDHVTGKTDVFLNGAIVGTITSPAGINLAHMSQRLSIGCYNATGGPFEGDIAKVVVKNAELTDADFLAYATTAGVI